MYAMISVSIMTAVGLLGVVIVPVIDKALFSKLLSFLGALAVGTLAGDALLHLLPHVRDLYTYTLELLINDCIKYCIIYFVCLPF